MPLIIEILTVWLLGATGAMIYQRVRARPWGEAAHLSSIFGIALAIFYFLALIAIDLAVRT